MKAGHPSGIAGLCFAVLATFSTMAALPDPKAEEGGWVQNRNVSQEEEGGVPFVRLTSTVPGEIVETARTFDIPAETGAVALEWRQRVTGLKKGGELWDDARLVWEFRNAAGEKLPENPRILHTSWDTKGWVEKNVAILVPESAVRLVVRPMLFQVKSGTWDLADFSLEATDPAPLLAKKQFDEEVAQARFVPSEEPKTDRWPAELRVQGNRLVDAKGKEIWLQGLNAGGLETLPQDEQPIKSAVVGVEEWKANVIRVPVKGDFWFGRSSHQKDGGTAYREKLDKIITLVANRGAYVALDLHHFRAPSQADAEFWKDAATRYKNHPAVLFDLFNEPFGVSWQVWRDGGYVENEKPAGVDESAFLSEEEKKKNQGFHSVGMQGLIEAVRQAGGKNTVIVGGLDWAYDLSGILEGYEVNDRGGNGVMLASHIYPWKSDWEGKVLKAAEKYPIFLGEVGADVKKMHFLPEERQEDPYTWVPDMLGAIQKYRLHWAGWCFHPAATPIMISDWKYTPTPFWGQPAKDALAGKSFEMKRMR